MRHPSPKIVRVASGVTMILFALTLYSGVQNPVAVLPQVLFLATVVVRLWARDPWAGYGGFFVLTASIGAGFSVAVRDGRFSRPAAVVAFTSLLLAGMYFVAGQALGALRPIARGIPWLAFAGLLMIFPWVFGAFVVPSGGMENTILQGDSLLILRQLGRTSRRGDIIAFRYPLDRRQSFLKRVVGVPGDRVRLQARKLVLNGTEVNEPYALHNTPYMDPMRDSFPQRPEFRLPSPDWQSFVEEHAGKDVTVPPGKLFVLGDNRDSSLDSRYWGFIDQKDVIGTPALVYWSEDRRRLRDEPEPSVLGKVRWGRVFQRL